MTLFSVEMGNGAVWLNGFHGSVRGRKASRLENLFLTRVARHYFVATNIIYLVHIASLKCFFYQNHNFMFSTILSVNSMSVWFGQGGRGYMFDHETRSNIEKRLKNLHAVIVFSPEDLP